MKDNFDTELECLTAFDIEEHSENLRVLVKHDYYSSDNEHGRIILDSLLDGLKNDSSKISSLIIIDSAVKLLSETEISYLLLQALTLSIYLKIQ